LSETVRRRARFAAALALLSLPLARAQPAPAQVAGREAELRELLAAAGVTRHVQEWPELTLPALDRAREQLDVDTLARLERSLAETFAEDALLAGVAGRLAAVYDEARAKTLREWYDSPQGRRIRSAENRAATPQALRELPLFLSRPAPRRVPPATRRAGQRLERATGLGRSILLVSQSVSRGLLEGVVALRCGAEEEVATLAAVDRRRVARLARLLPERISTTILFAYRDVPLSDLTEHAAFLESDAGRWLFGDLHEHLEGTLAAGERALRERLAPEAASRCPRPPPGRSRSDEPDGSGTVSLRSAALPSPAARPRRAGPGTPGRGAVGAAPRPPATRSLQQGA
jgi:hypothetical protein